MARLVVVRKPWFVKLAPYIISAIVLVIVPAFLPTYVQGIFTKFVIFAIFAMSLDLLFGYAGLYSLGHAAFFGVGSYTTGILILRFEIDSFWVIIAIVVLLNLVIGAVFGAIALRASGVYFLLLTVALGQLIFVTVWKWYSMTGGNSGLPGIPRPELGFPWAAWDPAGYYYFVLGFFVICFFLLHRIVNSSFGHTLKGIQANAFRMRHLGYNVWGYQYISFIIAAIFSGIAGMLFAYYMGIAVPSHAGLTSSILVFLMVVIGGAGTLFGPVIGAGVVVLLEFFVSLLTPEHWPLVLGSIFIATIMYFRGGLGVHLLKFWQRIRYD